MDKSKIKKIVLAYSGGLDTSIIIPWLKENYNDPEIIAVAADVGQGDELDGLEEKAIKTGASKLIIADLTDEMCDEIIVPSVMMDAKYEKYLLGTAFARPVIGKKLAEIALAEGADAIAHGATGKGNDQVRFELAIKRFAPDMPIIAPWREWDIKSRDEEIDYAEAHNVPLKISRETNYSKDKNLWHLSHEGLDLEDPANEPDLDKALFLEMGVSPYQAPDTPTTVSVSFEAGVPVAVDGEKMKVSDIIRKLNKLGGENGVGILDIVENRLIGMKDHGIYETPGGTILYFAHEQLEMLTLDKETLHMKEKLAVDYADTDRRGIVTQRYVIDEPLLFKVIKGYRQRAEATGNRGASCAAVSLYHVTVDGYHPLAEGLEIAYRPKGPADKALDLGAAPGQLELADISRRAGLGGAGQHGIFGRDPTLSGILQKGRNAVLDGCVAYHPCVAPLDKDRALGVFYKSGRHLDRPELCALFSSVCSHFCYRLSIQKTP